MPLHSTSEKGLHRAPILWHRKGDNTSKLHVYVCPTDCLSIHFLLAFLVLFIHALSNHFGLSLLFPSSNPCAVLLFSSSSLWLPDFIHVVSFFLLCVRLAFSQSSYVFLMCLDTSQSGQLSLPVIALLRLTWLEFVTSDARGFYTSPLSPYFYRSPFGHNLIVGDVAVIDAV